MAQYFRAFQILIAKDHIERGYSMWNPRWKIDPVLIGKWLDEISAAVGRPVFPVIAFARMVRAIRIESISKFLLPSDLSGYRIEPPVGIVVTTESDSSKARRQRRFIFRHRPLVVNGILQANEDRDIKGIKKRRKQPIDPLPAYWKVLSTFLKLFRGIPREQY